MSEFVFIGQDGTKYVFKAESVEIVNRGKQVFVNNTPVAEYPGIGDAREAAGIIKAELDCDDEHRVPVKHFQAEPFVDYAWHKNEIDEFLELVAKLPREFINEFFYSCKRVGIEEACKTAKAITATACEYDAELTIQSDIKAKVYIDEGR